MTARVIARGLVVVLLAACGSDSKLYQHVDDQQSFETGELQTIKLRRGGKVTTLIVPANVLPRRTRVTVSLVSGLVHRGCVPADDSAVEIFPAGLAFTQPVRMAQPVTPPPPQKHYAAAQVPDGGNGFVERGPGRRTDETADGDETWEVDVDGSGLWGVCASNASPSSSGGPNNGVVEDEVVIRLGTSATSVVLGASGPRRTYVTAPAQPAGVEEDVHLQLLSGVRRAGTPPANDGAVRFVPGPTPPPVPIRAQQIVSPPPPGRTYAVAVTPDDGSTWTPMAPAKQVPVGGVAPDGGVMAAVTDTGQRWEMELPRPGIYALVLVATDGTADGGTPDGTDGGTEPNPDGGAPDGGGPIDTPALLAANPSVLDFGSLLAGTTSGTLEVTIGNKGTLASGVPMLALSGADAASFAIATNGCTAALPGGTSCKVTLTFKPSAPGARQASLTIAAVPGESATVSLSGTGQAPGEIRVSPNRADFMAVTLGQTSAPTTIMVTNPGDQPTGTPSVSITGADAATFALATNGCGAALAPGGTCQLQVTFKPTAAGARTASLVVAATPGGQANVALAGTGAREAQLSVAPAALDFQGIETGKTSGALMLRVTNAGDRATGTIGTSRMGTNAPDFAVVADGCAGRTLAGGASCDVMLSFTPSGLGAESATFAITAAPGGSAAAQLAGTGLAPAQLAIAGSGAIGPIVVGSSGIAAFMVKNNGGVASGAPTVAVSGPNAAEFVVSKNTCTAAVAAGATCGVEVTFTPATTGARAATLTVSATPGGAPTAALSGTGLAPGALAMSPGSAAFADTLVGAATGTTTFMVTNQGGSPTGAPTVAITGANAASFAIVTNGCTAALGAGASCNVDVRFAPVASGGQTATLGVSATPGGTVTASLSGKALTPATLTIAPASADFGSSDTGKTALDPKVVVAAVALVKTFTVTNSGDVASGPVDVTLGGTNPGDFAISGDKCARASLSPGASCMFGTTFTPQRRGARTATVTATAAPGGSANATVTGTGTGAELDWDYTKAIYDFGTVPVNGTNPSFALTLTNVGDANSGPPMVSLVGDTTNFQVTSGATNCARYTNGMAPAQKCNVIVTVVLKTPGFHSTILRATGTPGGTSDIEFRVTEQ